MNYRGFAGHENVLTLSASVTNFIKSGDHELLQDYFASKLTVIQCPLNLYVSNNITSEKKFKDRAIYAVNLQFGYSDELDSKAYSLFRVGTELTFLETLTLRYAYSEGNDNNDYFSELNSAKNSFGAGLNIPLYQLFDMNLPLQLKFDYGHTFRNNIDSFSNQINKADYNSFAVGISIN